MMPMRAARLFFKSWHALLWLALLLGPASSASATVWYVNDTSTIGDSFTSAVGSSGNPGTSALPKRYLNDVETSLVAGDTIYVDSGFFYEPDTFRIDTNSIWVIGVDSVNTVIRFDTTSAAGARAIFCTGATRITLRDFRVTNGRNGIWFKNVDTSTIQRVRSDTNGGDGFRLDTGSGSGSDSNTLTNNASSGNSVGFNVVSSRYNTLANNKSSGNTDGFEITSSNNNTAANNTSSGNGAIGFLLTSSNSNTLSNNTGSTNVTNGFALTSSNSNTILNNAASNNSGSGIYLTGPSQTNILSNNTSSNNTGAGFDAFNGVPSNDSNIYSGNTSSNNTLSGFYFELSEQNVLTSNVSSSNSSNGFEFSPSSTNTLKGNVSRNNFFSGYYLQDALGFQSSNNVFRANTADSNGGWAFEIFNGGAPSTNDTFVKNNIITSVYKPDSGVTNGVTTFRFDFTRNYWMRGGVETTDSVVIRAMTAGVGRDSVNYTPFRLGTVDTAVGADTVAPRDPDTVAATAPDPYSIILTWQTVSVSEETETSVDLAGYKVYRAATSTASSWTLRGTVTQPTVTYTDSGLSSGQTWWYRVTAFDNHSPFENQSYFGDSIVGATTLVDTLGPNIWYVNDTSTVGDSFTSAVGSAGNTGLSISSPKLNFNNIEPFLTEGDTVYIDAGTFLEDTVLIDTNSIWLIGKDSASTIIDFADSSISSFRSIYADSQTRITIRNLAAVRGIIGVYWLNVDSSTIDSVRTDSHSNYGVLLTNGSESNLVTGSSFGSNSLDGLRLSGSSHRNTLSNNRASFGSATGFHIALSDTNILTGNTSVSNASRGYELTGNFNTLTSNSATSNSSFGIYLNGSGNNVLANNIASFNLAAGIRMFSANNNRLVRNTCSNNSGANSYGFEVISSNSNYFGQNTVDSNFSWGFNLSTNSSADTFEKNIVITSPYRADSYIFSSTKKWYQFARNWWGTIDSGVIKSRIKPDTILPDSIAYIPFRLGIVDTAIGADTVAPKAPDTVAVIPVDSSRIYVSWKQTIASEQTEAALNLTGYRVWRSATIDTTLWVLRGTVGATVDTYVDSGMAPQTGWYYRVTAFDNASPFENQSFFSDSIPVDTTYANSQTSANVWYVNDTSLVGDSWTYNVGSSSNYGQSPYFPVRSLNDIEGRISTGDTIYVDAGFYYEPDTFRIDTNSVWVIGKDSASSVIDFNNISAAGARAISSANVSRLTLRDFRVTRARIGVWWINVDTSVIDRVTSDSQGANGFHLQSGGDSNVLRDLATDSCDSSGIVLDVGADRNYVVRSRIRRSGLYGLYLSTATQNVIDSCEFLFSRSFGVAMDVLSDTNIFRSCLVDSSSASFYVENSYANTFESNTLIRTSPLSSGFALVFGSSRNSIIANSIEQARDGIDLEEGSGNRIERNIIRNNFTNGIYDSSAGGNYFVQNTIDSNAGWAIYMDVTSARDTYLKNLILGSPYPATRDSGIFQATAVSRDFSRNWWGTTDTVAIKAKIGGPGRDVAIYSPFRLGIVDTALGADTVAPKSPDTVAALSLGGSSIRVSWKAITADEEANPFAVSLAGYRIYRSATADTPLWVQRGAVGAATLAYDDAGLNQFETWFYRVTAVDSTTPFENQSFYSESVATATTTGIDTSGPNVWYVNDTSTSGDSFTSAVGYDTNNGLSPATPFRTLNRVEPFLTAGDTVYVDSGFFYENDTVTIDTNSIWLIGVDSVSTIVRFDTTAASQARALYSRNATRITISDLRVTGGTFGIWWNNVDSGVIDRVRADFNQTSGIDLTNGSTQNTVRNCAANSNSFRGIYLATNSDNNALSGNSANSNALYGIYLNASSNGNVVADNDASSNILGIEIVNSSSNTFSANRVTNNSTTGIDVIASNNVFRWNTIRSNGGYQISLGATASSDTFRKNIISVSGGSPESGVLSTSSSRFDLARNWWGSSDSLAVKAKIWGAGRDSVIYSPYRLGVIDTTIGSDSVAPAAPAAASIVYDSGGVIITWSASSVNEEVSGPAFAVNGYRVYLESVALVAAKRADDTRAGTETSSVILAARGQHWYLSLTAFDTHITSGAVYENEAFYSAETIVPAAEFRAVGTGIANATLSVMGTDTVLTFFQANADTLVVSIVSSSGAETLAAKIDFRETDRYVTAKRVPTADFNASDTSRIRKSGGGASAVRVLLTDSTGAEAGTAGNFADTPVLTYFYGNTDFNPNRLRFFSRNPVDSAWYELTDTTQPGGAHAAPWPGESAPRYIVDITASTIAIRIRHFSDFITGELYVDTVSVVLNDTIPTVLFARGADTLTVGAFFIRGDTFAPTYTTVADTLTVFQIRNLGLLDDTDIDRVRLWIDADSNFRYSAGDTFVADLVAVVGDPRSFQATLAQTMTASGLNFVVTIDLADTARVGDTFQAQISPNTIGSRDLDSGPVFAITNPAVQTVADTLGPNVWYVNDTSLVGDSFTSAVGSSANSGLSPSAPKRFLNDVEPFLTVGDTVYIDAGTYLEPDTVTIDTNSIWLIGVDSASTVIDFVDSSAAGARTIYAANVTNLTLQNFRVTRARRGVWWNNVDNSFLLQVRSDTNGSDGFLFESGSQFNRITQTLADFNNLGASRGFIFSSSANNTVESSTATNNFIGFSFSLSGNVTALGNAARRNATTGFDFAGSATGTVAENISSSNLTGFQWSGGSNACSVRSNVASQNTGDGFSFITVDDHRISGNTSDSNGGWGFSLSSTSARDTFEKNVFIPNPTRPDSGVLVSNTNSVLFARNWWGTTDSAAIKTKISGTGRDSVTYIPFRLGLVDTSPGADTVAPRAPDTVAAVSTADTIIRVAWAAVSVSEEPEAVVGLGGYRVYRSRTSDTSLWVERGRVGAGVVVFDDSGLTLGDSFFYRVTGVDVAAPFENQSFYSDSIAQGVISSSDSVPPNPFTLLAPVAGTETNVVSITFRWTLSSDSSPPVLYRLIVDTDMAGSFIVDTTIADSAVTVTLPADAYLWRVVARDSVFNTRTVGDSSFVIDTKAPTFLTVIAVSSAPGFFTDSGGIDTPAGFDTVYFNNTGAGAAQVCTISATFPAAQSVTFSAAFSSSLFIDTTAPYQAVYTIGGAFTTDTVVVITVIDTATNQNVYTIGFARDAIAPSPTILTAPLNGISTNDSTPTFTWTASVDTGAGVRGYFLQIAGDSAFNMVVESVTVSTTTYTSVGRTDSVYYWRVIPTDSVSNTDTAAASIFAFTISSAQPVIAALSIASSAPAFFFDDTPVTPGLTPDTVYFNPTGAGANQTDTITVFVSDSNETMVTGSSAFVVVSNIDVGFNKDSYTLVYRIPLDSPTATITIVATDVTGLSDTSLIRFERDTLAPTLPTLFAPAASTDTNSTTIVFSWAGSLDTGAGVSGYRLQIDTAGTFVSPVVDSATGLSLTGARTLSANDTYFWRVLVTDRVSNSAFSLSRQLRVDTTPPTAAGLVAPAANTDTNATAITFTWTAATDNVGISGYRLQIDTANTFVSLVVDSATGLSLTGAPTLSANDTYFWRVLATDSATNSTASASRQLVIDTTAPTAAGLVAPAANTDTNATAITFSWTAAIDNVGISGYRLQIDTANTFVSLVVDSATGLSLTGARTLSANDTYFWRVLATDSATNSTASVSQRLRVDTTAPTAAGLVAPTANTDTNVTTITFSWTAATDNVGISGYRLQIDTANTFVSLVVDSATGLSLAAARTLSANDTYFWRVIATDSATNSTASASRQLVVDTTPPTIPTLVAPINGDTRIGGIAFMLDWNASADSLSSVISYRVQVDTLGTFAANLVVDSTLTQPDTIVTLPVDTYFWRVIATDSAGNTATTSTDSFRVVFATDTTPPTAFTLLSPAIGFETASVMLTFRWSASSDSSPPISYRLIVDTDMAGSFIVDTTVSDTDDILTLPANDTYLWRVIASDALSNSRTVGDSSFVIDTTPPSVFSPLAPADGADTRATAIRFAWTASSDTISGLLQYQIQISTDSSFATFNVDSNVGLALETTVTLAANARYYWGVLARDDAGNLRVISAVRSVLIDTVPPMTPVLSSPASLFETSALTISFSWIAATDTLSGLFQQRVQIDTTGTFTSLVLDSVSATSTTHAATLPANKIYFWRVFATDSAQNTSASPGRQFLIDTNYPSVPVLVAPIGGASVASPILLDWNASFDTLSGVAGYRFQIDTTGSYTSLLVDSFQIAPDTTVSLPVGTYFWRVLAFDNVGNVRTAGVTGESFTILITGGPDSPQGVSATAGDQKVSLAWFISIETTVTGYTLYQGPTNLGPWTALNATPIGRDTPTFVDTGVVNGTAYFYYVIARDTTSFSVRSRIVSATPFGDTPLAPIGLAATPTDGSIILTWTANTEPDLGGYKLYRSLVSGGPYIWRTTTGRVSSWTDSGLTNDSTYYYVITAFDTEIPSRESLKLSEVAGTPSYVDTIPPTITHAPVTSATVGIAVTVSARIVDDRGLLFTRLRYRVTGQSVWRTDTLALSPPDSYSGIIAPESVTIAGVDYVIEAGDFSGNLGAAGTATNPNHVTVTLADTTAPFIVHVAPDSVTIATPVTLTAVVVDSTGISSVTLYFKPTGSATFIATSMSIQSGSTYRGTIPFDSVTAAGVDYRIVAVDLSANSRTAGPYSVPATGLDSTAPSIVHTPYTTVTVGAALAVAAEIRDNVGVAKAFVFFARISTPYDSRVMTRISAGSDFFSGTIPASVFTVADTLYRYYIVAGDTAGNTTYSPDSIGYLVTSTATTFDTTAPVIAHFPVTSAFLGETVRLSAVVTDDSAGVASVRLYWRQTGGVGFVTQAMTDSGGSFVADIAGNFVTTVGLEYAISAVDSAGNGPAWALGRDTLLPISIIVTSRDVTPPTIIHTAVVTAAAGQNVTISAQIVDNVGVVSASLFYRRSGYTGFQQIPMTVGASSVALIPADTVTLVGVEYYISAVDAAGNLAKSRTETSPYIITVVVGDTTPPTIIHTPITRTFVNRDLSVPAIVTDAGGVAAVTLFYRSGGSRTYTSVVMTLDSASSYVGLITATNLNRQGTMEYYISASDVSANTAFSGTETVPYLVRILTIPQDLIDARTYPNPWLPSSGGALTIHRLPPDHDMTIEIYDRGGGLVDKLGMGTGIEWYPTGNIGTWLGRTLSGRPIASGAYTILIRSSTGTRMIRMTIVK